MKRSISAMGACGVSLVAVTWATAAAAQTTVVTTEPHPAVVEQTTSYPPNVPLIGAGLIAFGGAYIPSVIVAAANNNSYDNHLYIPVVGPWLDLANRPDCGGFGQTSCGAEGGFKALLIIDGTFQGVGVLATALGFVVPERHTKTVVAAKADVPHVRFAPTPLGRDGYGVTALGNF